MSSNGWSFSVVVRTKDVENRFSELLQRLSLQTLQPSELVIVDNYSTNEKLEEMIGFLSSSKKRYFHNHVMVRLIPLTDDDFSHAYSTNLGVFFATHDLVCITNGHSLPLSNSWIESGVTHFEKSDVAGVGGYSIPPKDGTFWEKIAYGLWWRKLNEVSNAYVSDSYFSTMNCILRRSLWEGYPFDENLSIVIPSAMRFGGEDYDWASEMLARGYRIIVEPSFCIYHSHGEGLPILFSKYLAWRRIRKQIKMFRRPRKSYTRLKNVDIPHYDI
jgi:GT2 family glycosyltransferase